MKKLIILMLLLVPLVFAQTTVYISTCQKLSSSDTTYVLTTDVSSSGTCFTVANDRITLNCNGHSISGSNAGYAVNASDVNNITVESGNVISNYTVGIMYNNVSGGSILNNSLIYSGKAAVFVNNSYNINVTNNQINNTILDNTSSDDIGFCDVNDNDTESNLLICYSSYVNSSNNKMYSNLSTTSPDPILNHDGAEAGVCIQYSNHTDLNNNILQNTGDNYGIRLYNVNDSNFTSNIINGTVDGTNWQTNDGFMVVGEHNLFFNNTIFGCSEWGMFMSQNSYDNITSNDIYNIQRVGIRLVTNSSNNSVQYNNVSDVSNIGISSTINSKNNTIHDNNVEANNYGISIGLDAHPPSSNTGENWYNTVYNNNVGNATYGIYLDPSSGYSNITNNNINNVTYGIYLSSNNTNSLSSNAINSSNIAIGLFNSNSTVVFNNTANNSMKAGVFVNNSYNVNISSNKIIDTVWNSNTSNDLGFCDLTDDDTEANILICYSNNTIVKNNNAISTVSTSGQYNHDGAEAGICLQYSNYTQVYGNILNNTGDNYGIRAYYSDYHNTFVNNTISGYQIGTTNKNTNDGFIVNGDYNTLEDNTVYGSSEWGMFFNVASSNTIKNNHVYDVSIVGIRIIDNSSNNIIDSNKVEEVGAIETEAAGINVAMNSKNNTIRDNTVNNCNGYGIAIGWDKYHADSGANDYNNITGNIVYSNKYGISLDQSTHYNNIVNNTSHDNSEFGFYLSYVGSLTDSPAPDSPSPSSIRGVFTNNTANSNGIAGIYSFLNDTIIDNCTADNNYVGIWILGSNVTVVNSTANSNSQGGIYSGWGSLAITKLNITRNTLINNTNFGIVFNSKPSQPDNVENSTVQNNNIRNSYYGIYLFDGESNNTFKNNRIDNATKEAIYISDYDNSDLAHGSGDGCDNNSFYDNIINNSASDILLNSSSITNNYFINLTYNKSKVNVYNNATGWFEWYLNTNVKDALGNNVENANVSAYDKYNTLQDSDLTDANGNTKTFTLTEYWQNSTTFHYYTNYTVVGKKSGRTTQKDVNLTTNKNITLIFSDGISYCGDITKPGVYYLLNDISISSGDCINMKNSSITLDGQNYNITGGTNGRGILDSATSTDVYSNITIRNIIVDNFTDYEGIIMSNINDLEINNATTLKNGEAGINLQGIKDGIIRNCNSNFNRNPDSSVYGTGFWLWGTRNVTIKDSVAKDNEVIGFGGQVCSEKNCRYSDNINDTIQNVTAQSDCEGYGLMFYYGFQNTTVKDCDFTYNNEGIFILNSSNNVFQNNDVRKSADYGIYITDTDPRNSESGHSCNNNIFKDYNITNAGKTGEIYVNDSASTNEYFVNFTHAKENVTVSGSATAWFKWYLNVYVIDQYGYGILGVSVGGYDKDSNKMFSTSTDVKGHIPTQIQPEYWQNSTYSHYFSNYSIYANYAGHQQSKQLNLTNNSLLVFKFMRASSGGGSLPIVSLGNVTGLIAYRGFCTPYKIYILATRKFDNITLSSKYSWIVFNETKFTLYPYKKKYLMMTICPPKNISLGDLFETIMLKDRVNEYAKQILISIYDKEIVIEPEAIDMEYNSGQILQKTVKVNINTNDFKNRTFEVIFTGNVTDIMYQLNENRFTITGSGERILALHFKPISGNYEGKMVIKGDGKVVSIPISLREKAKNIFENVNINLIIIILIILASILAVIKLAS